MESRNSKAELMYLAYGDIKPVCFDCKGSCWVKPAGTIENKRKANFQTQAKAKEKFGFIPNDCIIDCDGNVRCPYANGLLDK